LVADAIFSIVANLDLPPDPWEATTWEGSRRAALLAGARMTLAEKLEWLEEINAFARRAELARGDEKVETAAAAQPRPTPR